MSKVRVLVGTRKGAFVLESDGKREKWDINGPHFAGWEIYHVKGSPADPNRLYASQSSGWSGQVVQRSDDGGKTWNPVGNKFVYDGDAGTHQWYDGTPHPVTGIATGIDGERLSAFVDKAIVPNYLDWEKAGITPREVFTEAGRSGRRKRRQEPSSGIPHPV